MKRFAIWVFLAPLAILAGAPAAGFAADLKAGKQKAMQCAVCHGPNGIAVNPDAPNLAGEASIYIEKQLKAFRSGARQNEMMTLMAKDLSDADIADLAAWFSAMKVSVTLPDVK
ncbi:MULTISPECIES: cytochrome c [Rhodomicrobium]|uniref:c-type cytochrome n=1 Tax=Rhodomicrobium TaxID=1068 RepID=UPI000B4A5EF3|nr:MULTISPECIES: cytochrome c [Rhodomicrobium]